MARSPTRQATVVKSWSRGLLEQPGMIRLYPKGALMKSDFQTEIDKCMAEVEEFLRKKRLRYEEYMALGGPDLSLFC
jgi:predicted transcriptional regulator